MHWAYKIAIILIAVGIYLGYRGFAQLDPVLLDAGKVVIALGFLSFIARRILISADELRELRRKANEEDKQLEKHLSEHQ